MKKFLIFVMSFAIGVVLLIYLAFLIIPPFINLDNFKPEVQKIVKETAKLNLDYSKIKLYSTPLLSIGAIVEDIDITLDDNSSIFKAPKIKAGIALPSLLTLTVKTSKCYVENPEINVEIINDEQYKIVKVVEDIINENNAKPKKEEEPLPPIVQNIIEKITIKVPSIKITDYTAQINDLKSSHSLTLNGEKLILGYDSRQNIAKIKTDAKLYSDDNENINVNIALSTSLPKAQPKDTDIDPEEKIKIPFVNIVSIYQTYDLKADIESRLRVRETKEKGYYAFGYFNVDNLTLKLSDIQLPNSYLHSKFHGKKIEYDSNIFATADEKIALNGFIKYGKRPRMKTNIVSEKLQFKSVLNLLTGLLNSLNIKNDLAMIDANGYFTSDATIKTNFKKLKSQGQILIKDGAFVNRKTNIGAKDMNINLIFDNNALNIKDSKATINGSKLSLEGKIDSKSTADIKINVDKLSIPELYNAFAPKEIKNAYNLNSLKLSMDLDIKGKLDKLNAKLKTQLDDLKLSDSKKTMFIANNQVDVDFLMNKELIKGEIKNNGFDFSMPSMNTNAKINDIKLDINNESIVINPFDFIFNNISKINIKGNIQNYQKDPLIDIFLKGAITTDNIKQTLGRDVSYYLTSKGSIPMKVSIKGNAKKQNIIAQIYSDNNNFITPINLNSVLNAPCLMQADIKLQGDKIKIRNSGFYKKASLGFSDELALNMQGSKQIADLTSTIEGSHINLLRLTIPEEQTGSIAIFKKSSFKTKGKISLNGYFDKLVYGGDLKIYDLSIPEILFKIKNIDMNFFNHSLDINAKNIDLNGSLIDGSLKADLNFAKVFKISDINIASASIDVDKAMEVVNNLMKYMPPQNISSKPSSSQNANIPIAADGKFDIKKIKTGLIEIFDIKGSLGILNNDLLINKLSCKAWEGTINGDIKMNLISQLLTVKVQGDKINADEMMTKAVNLKDTLSGTFKFKTDISLKGATYLEQMKSLKGNISFEGENGVYGPFSKLENFFLAENIRENPVFKNTIGIILTPLTTIDSSHYEKLTGKLDFNNGVVNLNSITSQGDILCVLIKGNMNLINNKIDSNVRVRLASAVSDMLGPIAVANPVNLVKNTPGLNIATAKLFTLFTQVVQKSEYQEIPDFSSKHSDNNATKFQIILKGDVAKPLSLVKSFKWLALQEDVDKAKEFSDKYIKEQEDLARQALMDKLQKQYELDNKLKVGAQKVLQMDTTAPQVKDILIEEILENKKQEAKQALQNKNEEIKQQLQNKINEKNKENQQKLENLQEQLKSKLKTPSPIN